MGLADGAFLEKIEKLPGAPPAENFIFVGPFLPYPPTPMPGAAFEREQPLVLCGNNVLYTPSLSIQNPSHFWSIFHCQPLAH